jgi:type IV pilus assembly protein PilB
MAEEIISPLLALVRSQSMIDDLQYEEVVSEAKRSGTSVSQILQDFGIMDMPTILDMMANHLGTEVISIKDRQFPAELLKTVPANTAKMYQCLPVEDDGAVLKIALADPLDTAKIDELNYVVKRDVQVVVADPNDIEKALEKHYGSEGADFSDILKQLGGDEEIAKEVAEVTDTDDEQLMANLANEAPIVRFVNLVLLQAVQDRASDIHFEPFETEFRIRYRVDGALYEMSKASGATGDLAHQGHGEPEHLRAPRAAGRTHRLQTRRAPD